MDYLTRLQTFSRRNTRILRLRQSGWTLERIAKECGITRQRVEQIIKQGKRDGTA